MEGECFLCYFIVSEHIELACFFSHFIELKVQSGSVPFTKLFFSFEYWGKLLDKSKSKTQNRHETEPACSPQNWTSVFMNQNSIFLLCLPTVLLNWKFHRAAFIWKSVFSSRTTRANPVFKSSISNWRFSRQHFQTELNECVYHAVELMFKTQIGPVCHRIKRACSAIKLACSLSLWLCPSNLNIFRNNADIGKR